MCFFLYYIKLFFIYPPPFPLLLYMATLTVVHQTYTEEACYCFLYLSEYGDSASEKHPLLYFLTKPSQHHQFQTAGAVMLQLALKLQKRENFSVISERLLFTNSQLCHFTNQAQGDRRGSKLMNFTKELILDICFVINTKMQRVFNEIRYLYQFLEQEYQMLRLLH